MRYIFAVRGRYGTYHREGPSVGWHPTALCGRTPRGRLAAIDVPPAGYVPCRDCERAS